MIVRHMTTKLVLDRLLLLLLNRKHLACWCQCFHSRAELHTDTSLCCQEKHPLDLPRLVPLGVCGRDTRV